MGDAKQTIDEMLETAKSLENNAQELLGVSQRTIDGAELQGLQEKQQELINTLTKLDRKYQKGGHKPMSDEAPSQWKKIEKHIDTFQQLNTKFIDNLKVRQGLIHFDLDAVKKARKSVVKVKGAYGTKTKARKSGKINTLS